MKHMMRGVSARLLGSKRRFGMGTVAAVTLCFATPAHAVVTAPFEGENLQVGMAYDIAWDPLGACSTVSIDLYRGTRFICNIATGETDDGLYRWTVDLCDLPACDYVIRVSCAGESVRSSPFALEGLLLEEVIPGSRNVQLRWRRVPGDTLGASNRTTTTGDDSTPAVPRIFGGYNVWRRVYDNELNETITDRFTKIRTYDVLRFRNDTIPSAWTFAMPSERFGPVLVDLDEETTELQTWVAAQTFTTPPGPARQICNIRIFNASLVHRWNVTARLTPVDAMGLPVLSASLGSVVRTQVGTQSGDAGFLWQQPFIFTTPVTLQPDTQYALVFSAEFSATPADVRSTRMTWVRTSYDALAGGSAIVSLDDGATWEVHPDEDFAFVLGAQAVSGGCVGFLEQRRGGTRDRAFNDPDSLLAFGRDEEGELIPLDPQGPFNGFELEYAVTTFERVRLSSGNVETPATCEDTLFTDTGFPLGVQPSENAIWPEIIFPQSRQPTSSPLLANVYPVPNPYVRDVTSPSFPRWERPGERRIDFVNLPERALIRIYTIAGDLVRTFRHTDSHGTARWNLRNDDDEIVVSGVYIWMVTTDSGETKRGQLVIVR